MYGSMPKHKKHSAMHSDDGHMMANKGGAKAGRAIRTGQPNSWTAGVGGQAAGLVRPGKARKRKTMDNRGEGTGLAGSGRTRMGFPRPDKHGYY